MKEIQLNNSPTESSYKEELKTLYEKLSDREKQILEAIITKAEGYRTDILDMQEVIVLFLDTLGVMDPKNKKQILPEIVSGEEKPIPYILKAIGDVTSLMIQAQVPIVGKSAEKRLAEKFSFIPKIIPLVKKYSEGHG